MKIAAPPALVASPVSSVAGHSVELPCDARPSIQGDQVLFLPSRPIGRNGFGFFLKINSAGSFRAILTW